jgi:ferrous iron transport protein B
MDKIALIGNPNSGKSSIFNALSGLNQSVGNFPGVTVEKKVTTITSETDEVATLIDFPGLYSLYPNSKDEQLVSDILTDENHSSHPDRIVYVVDVLQLERHLLLATQIIDMGFPVIVAVNMIDISKEKNLNLNLSYLEDKLGVPVIPVSARTKENITELKREIFNADLTRKPKAIHQKLIRKKYDDIDFQVNDTMARFDIFSPWIPKIIIDDSKNDAKGTSKIDSIITHKIFGPIIFFAILLLVFQALFSWASIPMDYIDSAFSWLGNLTKLTLGTGWLSSLIADGIIAGIGGIVIFVPQILILFLFLGLLEEIGYMSRAIYLFDGLLRKFGLSGKSVVALVSGGACAIPAIMSTRTITNWKERLITIMVTPLISCSARLPVYIILIEFIVPEKTIGGIFSLQALFFMGIYILSVVAALGSAWVMKKVLKSNERSFLLMELPRYKKPIWRNIFLNVKEKVVSFVWEAGKIIFFISILLWFLASFGPTQKMEEAVENAKNYALVNNLDNEERAILIASTELENSFAGILGKTIEPVIKPLGYDWKIGIALITSFAAREVFVSTMATIYAVGSEDESTLKQRMKNEKHYLTGEKVYSTATAFSLLLFYLFAMQCMSTLAITKRETNSWKWPIIQFVFMTIMAYLAAFAAYQLLS